MIDPTQIATDMIRDLDALTQSNGHIGRVRRYLKGDQDLPFTPLDATPEYRSIARKSITNWVALVSETFAKSLFVDGYRIGRSQNNVEAWSRYWQANQMDARQTIPMRGAIDYGTAYVLVRPGDTGPVIKCLPAHKTYALYADDDDEYPIYAIARVGETLEGEPLYDFYMGDSVYRFKRTGAKRMTGVPDDPYDPNDGSELRARSGTLTLISTTKHGMGDFVPWVRFRDRLDDEAVGLIRPLLNQQDQINELQFAKNMAIRYASFRQRWATGLAIPRDERETILNSKGEEVSNPNFGKPLDDLKAALDRLWVSESPDSKFGDFAQTDVSGHLQAYKSAVQTLIALGQTSPLVMGSEISNLSTEALAILNDSMNRKVRELQVLFGEAWEQVFALAAIAEGEEYDPAAQVRWRDTEPRSFAQIVDGLMKLHSIGAPAEGLFEMVPGLTDTDIERWTELVKRPSDLDRLTDAMRTMREAA